MKSFVYKNVRRKKGLAGDGLFAINDIRAGELVVDFSTGPGTYLPTPEADVLYEEGNDYMLQVDDDLFFAAADKHELEDADFINHSCEPNCGVRGSLQIVAMCDIKTGEEITFDYAMSESSDFQMQCRCGARTCRSIITGNDWKSPILQKRYSGYFSDYLQKKMVKDPRAS
ncbi:hypothetical protein A3H16_03085 [Candidatus Kaiserbacteria bacterium RIFCSPLOWO2_12_FULL_53_8]|uniref:SET domain-containing protein-lysine N-methyltransferase n=2 Tax=Candidatus Kaiseribacteriota TaxID=1752734 RepID=A0A1F6CVX2_9BACT|nr:MAG: hypothetical protein A2851_02840 [Candidatus Kaiserbacteria bacterium RIFCSPHIGHO2_01_FULL_53_29]OGG91177.1 MAG: hypothetical protein A3H16_03085 [Candidatus Kaiserbacteria bacterium RIFCSPLOWO2_12_FULL_53_8]